MPDFRGIANKLKDIAAGKNPFAPSEQMTCPECKGTMIPHTGPRTFVVPTPRGKVPLVIYDVKTYHCAVCGKSVMGKEEEIRVEKMINDALGIGPKPAASTAPEKDSKTAEQ